MRFLIILFLLTSICFAQDVWVFESIAETYQDMAGKYRVRVLITDGMKEECIMLKFQTQPTQAQIIAEAEKVCIRMNTPEQKKSTIEELKEIIEIKDIQIEGLKLQLKVITK